MSNQSTSSVEFDSLNHVQHMKVSGNYDPRDGFLFKALNLIENEIFYRDPVPSTSSHGLIQGSLLYLNYDLYK